MKTNARRARPYLLGVVVVSALLAATGVSMLLVKQPERGATDAANRGFFRQPGSLSPMADLHENLAALLLLVIITGGAWLMVRVKQDWVGAFGAAAAGVVIAGFTGLLIQYEAVLVDGRFDPDLRGSGFVFDGDFEAALYGTRLLDANLYRLFLVLHISAAVAAVAAVIAGLRSLDRYDDDIWDDGRRRRDLRRVSTDKTAV